ncbi:GNAT family N-acetyltransferase [Microlunatus elymi]|uniref:GNAT family N-acetyltransferase n=1 Tax=Microlunatus elymi TaxID=2596828 RepID=UPI00143CEE58|nr:GNAT family N-acetyltransferase [Microlunatus elymi]
MARSRPAPPALGRVDGVDWSPLTEAELPEVSGLLTAIEHFDDPAERHTLEELQEAFAESAADPEHNARIGRDRGGVVVAYGWVHPFPADVNPRRVFLDGGVHPGWRRRGIGHELLDWELARAAEWDAQTRSAEHGPLQLTVPVEEKFTDRAKLVCDRKFSAVRWFADMSLKFEQLDSGVPAVPRLPGIRLEPFRVTVSEQVRQAHNEAFADHWGSQPVPQVRWQERLAASSTRTEWSWVALDDASGEVAGYAMNAAYPQDWEFQGYREGWTDRLGVRRNWRNRGIAKALLIASMRSFADAGLDGAGLGVDTDNPTGAFGLYTRLGYHRGETQVMYARIDSP